MEKTCLLRIQAQTSLVRWCSNDPSADLKNWLAPETLAFDEEATCYLEKTIKTIFALESLPHFKKISSPWVNHSLLKLIFIWNRPTFDLNLTERKWFARNLKKTINYDCCCSKRFQPIALSKPKVIFRCSVLEQTKFPLGLLLSKAELLKLLAILQLGNYTKRRRRSKETEEFPHFFCCKSI